MFKYSFDEHYHAVKKKLASIAIYQEKEIMKKLADGQSSADISNDLHITIDTVKTHRKNIYQKLSIKCAHDLLEYARAFDLI